VYSPGVSLEKVLQGELSWYVIDGDCLPVLDKLPERIVTHVITDPPYDVKTHTGARRHGKAGEKLSEKLEINFPPIDPHELAQKLLRVADRWVLAFCALEQLGAYQMASGPSWIRSGVYRRTNPAPQFTGDRPGQACEGIAIMHRAGKKTWNGGGSAAFWSSNVERGRVHETQKPLDLMIDIIDKFTDPGDVVLDPFSGSGTTGVAALMMGRRYIGIECNPEHAANSRNRLVEAAEQERHNDNAREMLAEFFA
jgi:site-specific DNA-methyltransferase (adenine-specific)